MKTDVLIVGSGCSGLYCALNLPRDIEITIITKSDLESNDSYLAQGGMCMLKEAADYESFFEDTLKAGHYENDRKSVEIMIKSSPEVVKDLVSFGADFEREDDGSLAYTREGAHSNNRIIFHEDVTGKEITSTLLRQVMLLLLQQNIMWLLKIRIMYRYIRLHFIQKNQRIAAFSYLSQ